MDYYDLNVYDVGLYETIRKSKNVVSETPSCLNMQ
jgi:hypothetical protein